MKRLAKLLRSFISYKPKYQIEVNNNLIKNETKCEYYDAIEELNKARKLKIIFDQNYKESIRKVNEIQRNKGHILFGEQ